MDINNILKKLFGNKSTRDMKEIQPHVEKIKQVFESIDALDNENCATRFSIPLTTCVPKSVVRRRRLKPFRSKTARVCSTISIN